MKLINLKNEKNDSEKLIELLDLVPNNDRIYKIKLSRNQKENILYKSGVLGTVLGTVSLFCFANSILSILPIICGIAFLSSIAVYDDMYNTESYNTYMNEKIKQMQIIATNNDFKINKEEYKKLIANANQFNRDINTLLPKIELLKVLRKNRESNKITKEEYNIIVEKMENIKN